MEVGTIVVSCMCFLLLLIAICISSWVLKCFPQGWQFLPPGSMGWPFAGETLQLYSQNPAKFFDTRHQRHGDIFKTQILGYPSIMLTSAEAARFVLVGQAKLFKPSYPRSKHMLIGSNALFFHDGSYHSILRKLVQSSLSLEVIRGLIPDIEAIAISTLESWGNNHGQVVNTYYELKKFAFDVAVLSIFGKLNSNYRERLVKNYFILDQRYNCFPVNLPGFPFRKAFLARKQLSEILHAIIVERRERPQAQMSLLSSLVNLKDRKGHKFSNDQIADNIIGVLFAAQDTTASVLTWTIKYMNDHQEVLRAVEVEQKAIYESNGGGCRSLQWAQTRNMSTTHRVIMESLRMASVVPFVFREAVVDVTYNGFLIPKGWKVMPLLRSIHHDPKVFSKPENFDPSRFKVGQKPNTYLPFGNGIHACPGNEIAKLVMLVFIHHLVNNFRWEVTGSSNEVQYDAFPIPKKGLQAQFWKEK